MRQRPPPRRRSTTHEFSWGLEAVPCVGTVSYDSDGRLCEAFFDASKPGSAINIALRDMAIAASLALQYGCPADELARALERDISGSPQGPLAILLDTATTSDTQGTAS